MRTQAELGAVFKSLHERDGAFIIPNPWDAGTARLLAGMGFEALATTSAGMAFSTGMRDSTPGRDAVMAHCRTLAAAVDLPVSADLGNCFGDDPATVAETMAIAATTGLAGASVEDMRDDRSIYDIGLAAERVRAAADVAHGLAFPFTLTARAENFLVGRRDLADTISRLQAYQEAGADVLYAPGLSTREEIAAVVSAVDRPINVIAGVKGFSLTVADLQSLGVKRISVGSALSRVAITAALRGAEEMRQRGTFTFAEDAIPHSEINARFDS